MTSNIIENASADEILAMMDADTPISKVRQLISAGVADIAKKNRESKLAPVDIRRMEFQIANDICILFGVGLE